MIIPNRRILILSKIETIYYFNNTAAIEIFTNNFSYGYISERNAFVESIISITDPMTMLNDNNPDKFRKWTTSLIPNANLSGYFYNECENGLSNKWL